MLLALTANIHRGEKSSPYQVSDFMPNWSMPDSEIDEPNQVDWTALEDKIRAYNQALGGIDKTYEHPSNSGS